MKRLSLENLFSRKEVHSIFSPRTTFTPQSGTWGLHGIVKIPERPGDYVFFVTYGQEQGGHAFDEGITSDGVLSWQSQPRQSLDNEDIINFINHNELTNSIYLFLRTRKKSDYNYLGKLKYLFHDLERQNPVYFQWQILDWNKVKDPLFKSSFEPISESKTSSNIQNKLNLNQVPKAKLGKGVKTNKFQAFKSPDFSGQELKNKKLGLLGEKLVLEFEKQKLHNVSRPDLANQIVHTSSVEGDGAGYDIKSFDESGNEIYIEVKTTKGNAKTSFFMSSNEVAFSKSHPSQYFLYRLYNYDGKNNAGDFFVLKGDMQKSLLLEPTQFRVSLK